MAITDSTHSFASAEVNSHEWWEQYFVKQWAQNHGSEQTHHFMERLIANLNDEVRAHLGTRSFEMLDWGCAFGEGVQLLSACFPHSRITGLDYAENAIAEAKKRHPQNEFILSKADELPRVFDVIITSNCLEHFAQPLEVIKRQLPFCRELYIVLVPYNEYPLCEFHRAQFREESFPERLGDFSRLAVRVIEVDPSFWPGQQLLVVYASPAYLAQRNQSAGKAEEQEKWDRYYADLPLFTADACAEAFHVELTKLVGDLLPQGSTTLEAGCGGGWQSLALAQAGYGVSLLDFSPKALQYARQLFAREKQTANFTLGDALSKGEPDYDLVFNAGALEHYKIDEQVAYLRAMASRSRRYVLVLVPNRACYWYWLWRIKAASNGQWSYGKEMPTLDLSAAFRAAGLNFLGQTFVGSAWTESFINNLPGLSPALAENIVTIHRSPLIPLANKSYLLAALGSVLETADPVPSVWLNTAQPSSSHTDELTGALADLLALSIRRESEVAQPQPRKMSPVQAEQGGKLLLNGDRSEKEWIALKEERDQARRLHQQASGALSEIHHAKYWKALSRYWSVRDLLRRKKRKLQERVANIPKIGALSKRLGFNEQETAPNHQLQPILERVKNSKGVVIFLPSIGWNVILFQRPHHLARAFAQRGYVVIFDCTGGPDEIAGFQEIESNLFLFKGEVELLAQLPSPLLWSFTYNFQLIDHYPVGTRVIYDWIDDLEVFAHDPQFLASNHQRALREATYVCSVAQRLHQQALAQRPDAFYLPNGVELERFANESTELVQDAALADWLNSECPLAGYYGALASWFDYDLLEAVARLRPDWNFVLIGPDYDHSLPTHSVLQCSNVRWLGPRAYETLPGYLKAFTVALIPFVINDITLATSPLKLYEYFAGGKPVITTAMPECMAFAEVNIVHNANGFSAALDVAQQQHEDVTFRQQLRNIAQQHSWQVRVEETMRVTLSPPASTEAERLSNNGLAVAEQFQLRRSTQNTRFFAAVSEYFATSRDNPCLPLYFDFAISSNERGRNVVKLLKQYMTVRGKNYLDVGCAYGGFLVAFTEAGAQVAGFDINEGLLQIARHNLQDHGIQAPLLRRDATQAAEIMEFANQYNIITCNDVIEHVTDPQALLHHISLMLCKNGQAYFEIPNGQAVSYVLQDGHYQLYGITLLDFPDATRYYNLVYPNGTHDVYSYFTLERYGELFKQAGLEMTVLDESLMYLTQESVVQDLLKLEYTMEEKLLVVPEPVRPLVAQNLKRYLAETAAAQRVASAEKRDFLLRYGAGFWKVIARKIG